MRFQKNSTEKFPMNEKVNGQSRHEMVSTEIVIACNVGTTPN